MKTIQMEIDDDLLTLIEQGSRETGTTQSEFINDILKQALQQTDVTPVKLPHTAPERDVLQ